MKGLINNIKWDLFLIYKYGIIAVAFSIAVIYCISLYYTDTTGLEKLIAYVIFSDPVTLGFLFTAVIILFEKDALVHQVIAITSMPIRYYVWSKAITFSLLSLVCSCFIMLSARPQYFNAPYFLLAVIGSSSLFVFIAIIGVSFVNSFNQFILLMPIVLMPTCLPLLDYFDIVNSYIFYIIPTQACLLLFKASVGNVEIWKVCYSIIYLIICNYFAYKWAFLAYKKRILKTSRNE